MLLIYISANTPRSKYIFDVIFKNEFAVNFRTTNDLSFFEKYTEEKINYSAARQKGEFFIKANSLLSENSIEKKLFPDMKEDNGKILFQNPESCDLGFDIFSATFIMLSRYEEYLPFTADAFGRYRAEDSLAYRNNFLHIPVVDKWIQQFKNVLEKKFPTLIFKKQEFKALVTYDIDVAYKFLGRSFKRNLGSVTKDLLRLDFKNIQSRIKTFSSKQPDPWDIYDYLKETITKNNLPAVFFFLLAENTKHDRNLDYNHPLMKTLVNHIKSFSETGIHPSFNSGLNPKLMLLEKEKLEWISGKKITKSRQHFLKFSLPETYNSLIDAGITEDYSMGFSTVAGFRAGTSKPFYFYDLKNEKATLLKIFPVTLMDGNYMNEKILNPEKILENITGLINEVRKVNGTFISIWHNHTASETEEFKNWRFIHDQMIQKLVAVSTIKK
jgi:hypothetical protein